MKSPGLLSSPAWCNTPTWTIVVVEGNLDIVKLSVDLIMCQ